MQVALIFLVPLLCQTKVLFHGSIIVRVLPSIRFDHFSEIFAGNFAGPNGGTLIRLSSNGSLRFGRVSFHQVYRLVISFQTFRWVLLWLQSVLFSGCFCLTKSVSS